MNQQFSKKPAFNKLSSVGVPIYDLVFRIMANSPDGSVRASGTCSLIANNLAITAKHVVEDFLNLYGATQEEKSIIPNFSIWIIQIVNDEPLYAVWSVKSMWLSPHSDIALLQLVPYNNTAVNLKTNKQLSLSLLPPPVGSRVFGVGFHTDENSSSVTYGIDGVRNIVINDEPYATVGEVIKIYPDKRDSTVNFPVYQVNFKSKGGMSGGPVFNDEGKLCGIICKGWNFEDSNENDIAFITTLWPMLGMIISGDRGERYARGVNYPVIELAKDNIIDASGWDKFSFDQESNSISIKIQ